MDLAERLEKLIELYRTEALEPGEAVGEGDEVRDRRVGEAAVRCIALALLAAGRDPGAIKNVLDLPCGHGRVLRSLQKVLPGASFAACDADRDAVDSCARTFGARAVHANAGLSGIELPDRYDLIWCGSLFFHLDAPRWRELLQLFGSALAPGGILVFTTGGPTVPRLIGKGWDYSLPTDRLRKLLEGYRDTGFGYVDYEGKVGHGISVARPSWTMALLQEFPRLEVLTYLERGWDEQDVVACAESRPDLPAGPHPYKTADLDLAGL